MAEFREGKLGVGIRGTGQVAVQHAEAIRDNPYVYVAAICGRSLEKAQALADRIAPNAKVFDSYEAMLDCPEVEIVVECMPNYLHASESLLALIKNILRPTSVCSSKFITVRSRTLGASCRFPTPSCAKWPLR